MIDVIHQTEMTMDTYSKSNRKVFSDKKLLFKIEIFLIHHFKPCIHFNTGYIGIPKEMY